MKTVLNILIFSFPLLLKSQPLLFQNYSEKNGMPQSHTLISFQDSQGFIWVGMTDGLCRFDGKKFKEFRKIRGDSTSLVHNFIKCIAEDNKGNIWIGTKSGLCFYSPENEEFTPIKIPADKAKESANHIHTIIEDSKQKIWFGTYEGLFRIDPTTEDILHFYPDAESGNSIVNKVVWDVVEDANNQIWIATNNGLSICKNDENFSFKNLLPDEKSNGLTTGQIFKIDQQKNGTIWLGTADGMYFQSNQNTQFFFEKLGQQLTQNQTISTEYINDFYIENQQKIWIAPWMKGLDVFKYSSENKSFQKEKTYRLEKGNEKGLPANLVENIMQDNVGILWVSTGLGLAKAAPNAQKFHPISSQSDVENSLGSNGLNAFLEDSNGNYWFGTSNGLSFLTKKNFDSQNFDFQTFRKSKNQSFSLSNNYINALFEDSQGILWIATRSGLNFIDLKNKDENIAFQHFKFADGLPHDWVYEIQEIRENEYWVATYGQLSKMKFNPKNPDQTIFQNFDQNPDRTDALVNATTFQIAKDGEGNFWVATFSGLSKIVEAEGQIYFENYLANEADSTALQDNTINVLFLDSQDRFWVGTRGGLHLMNQEIGQWATFKVFDENEGLTNKIIQSIEEDLEGNFWIGTNRGLNVFNPNLALAGKKALVKHYSFEDGLLGNLCIGRASYKDSAGNLFFGFGGLMFFHPDQILQNQQVPNLVLTDFKLFNKSQKPSSKKGTILQKSINFTKELILNYQQNMLTIEFAALDFSAPEKNQYAYRLERIHSNWISLNTQNFVTLSNLASGEYHFQVKGSNNDGIWSKTRTLKINILPPPWKTWWAYLFYFLGMLGVFISIYKYRIYLKISALEKEQAIEKVRLETREQLRKKNAADFHDELGHRLTKISLFLELAERASLKQPILKEYLFKIKQNAAGLSLGIRDLIWTLDPQKDTLFATLIRLQEFGDKLFAYSEIVFETKGIIQNFEQIVLTSDVRKQILLIFKEAMNNCLKYSEASQAKLEISSENSDLKITFSDNGKGFELTKIQAGYGLKNMQTRAKKINTELKITSNSEKGTSIELSKIPQTG